MIDEGAFTAAGLAENHQTIQNRRGLHRLDRRLVLVVIFGYLAVQGFNNFLERCLVLDPQKELCEYIRNGDS